jgi:hypothetical protein
MMKPTLHDRIGDMHPLEIQLLTDAVTALQGVILGGLARGIDGEPVSTNPPTREEIAVMFEEVGSDVVDYQKQMAYVMYEADRFGHMVALHLADIVAGDSEFTRKPTTTNPETL